MLASSIRSFTSATWWMEQLSMMTTECLSGKGCIVGIKLPLTKSRNLVESVEPTDNS